VVFNSKQAISWFSTFTMTISLNQSQNIAEVSTTILELEKSYLHTEVNNNIKPALSKSTLNSARTQ